MEAHFLIILALGEMVECYRSPTRSVVLLFNPRISGTEKGYFQIHLLHMPPPN